MSGLVPFSEGREDTLVSREIGYKEEFSVLDSWGAAGHEAYLDNPEQAAMRMKELYDANQELDKISEEDFKKRYAGLGLEWDADYSERGAELIAERKREELRRRRIMSENSEGLVNTVGMFGASLAASLLSPTNIGMSFIPVGGQARWLNISAKYGKTLGALAKGGAAGFAGAAMTEPLAFAARKHEQADYTAMDALYNVTLGGVLGAGLHYGGQKLGDLLTPSAQKFANGQMEATHVATLQLIDGKRVDVSAIKAATDTEIILHNRSVRAADMAERRITSTLSPEDVKAGRAAVQVTKQLNDSVTVKFSEEHGRLAGLEATGKTKEEAVTSLISEHERLRYSLDTDPNASKIEQLQRKLETLVVEREVIEELISSRRKLPKNLRTLTKESLPIEAILRGFDNEITLLKERGKALHGIDPTGKAHEIKTVKKQVEELTQQKASFEKLMKRVNLTNAGEISRAKLKEIKTLIKQAAHDIKVETVNMAQTSLRAMDDQTSDLFYQEDPEGIDKILEEGGEVGDDAATKALDEAEEELFQVLGVEKAEPEAKVEDLKSQAESEKPSAKEGTPIEDGKAQEAEVDLANLSDVERADFYVEKVGDAQRNGDPETLMVAAQDEMGGGMQSFAIEHIGDLTHRMADKNTLSSMGFADVKDKVTKVLDKIDQEFGFAKENRQNLENNALSRFAEQEGIEDVWAIRDTLVATPKFKEFFNTYMDGVTQKLEAYADAHSKIPVFNKPQKLARDAAVFMGRSDFLEAGHALRQLSKILDEGQEAWVKAAREFDPEIAGFGRDAEVTGPRKALFDLEAEVLEAKTRLGEDSEEFDDFLIEADSRRHDLLGREKGRTPKHFFSKAPRFKLAQETEDKLIPDDVKFDEGGAPGAKEVDAPTPEAEARSLLDELSAKLSGEERLIMEEGLKPELELATREKSLQAGISCLLKGAV